MAQNGLSVRNLFELSQKSEKQTFLNAKAELMHLHGVPVLTVQVSTLPVVRVHLSRSGEHVAFHFYTKQDPKHIELENYKSKTVEFQNEGSTTKRSIVLHENPGTLGEYECALESMEEFLEFVTYLHNLFGALVFLLNIKGNQGPYLARLSSIEKFRECGNVTISDGTLSNEEMRQVLKFRKVSILNCIPEPDFELKEPIPMENFHTNYAHWFNRSMLMQLDCEMLQISSLHLQNAHINAFLHHWMRMSDRKLRNMQLIKGCREIDSPREFDNRLDVRKNWEEEKFDLLKITEGLSNFEEPEAHLGNNLCFRRRTDGMLMTVSVHNDQEWSSTCFLRITS